MSQHTLRIEYGRILTEMGKKHPSMVVLEADLQESTQSIQFKNAFPHRYFDVGVSEQNMVGMAAGLALSGHIPVAHSFACFISMRACEQVRTSVAYPNLNVKLVVSHGGLSPGSAGSSHHATEDIAIMRAIPNMMILVPGDVRELEQAVEAMLGHKGPVYLRLGSGDAHDVYSPQDHFSIGKATRLLDGEDATIITTGYMVHEGIQAAEKLRQNFNLKVRLLQMACLKPIDREAILAAARETKRIVTVEEHNVIGGLGSAVCEIVAEEGGARVVRMGINDQFAGIGTWSYLLKEQGLTVDSIVQHVLSLTKSS